VDWIDLNYIYSAPSDLDPTAGIAFGGRAAADAGARRRAMPAAAASPE